MKAITTIVLSTLLTGGLACANAAVVDGPSVKADYSDLDLSILQGQSALYERLKIATCAVCPQTVVDVQPLTMRAAINRIHTQQRQESLPVSAAHSHLFEQL